MKDKQDYKMSVEEFLEFLGRKACSECKELPDEMTLDEAWNYIEENNVIDLFEHGKDVSAYKAAIVKMLNYASDMYAVSSSHE